MTIAPLSVNSTTDLMFPALSKITGSVVLKILNSRPSFRRCDMLATRAFMLPAIAGSSDSLTVRMPSGSRVTVRRIFVLS